MRKPTDIALHLPRPFAEKETEKTKCKYKQKQTTKGNKSETIHCVVRNFKFYETRKKLVLKFERLFQTDFHFKVNLLIDLTGY